MQVRLDMLISDYVRNTQAAAKATLGIATAAEKPKSALDRVKEAAGAVGTTLVAAGGIGAAAIATWGVSAFAAGAAFNTLQQTAGQALITVLGSAGAASAQMEELVSWSRTSPFPRQLWIEAQQTLLGFGFAAADIVPTLAAIQDGMVAVGGGEQQIREVIQVLAKVNSTGNVTAGTLNELAYRGIDAAALIGEAFGKTADEIRTEVSRGAIDAEMFLGALTTNLQSRFAGAAEGLRTTWVGAVDRIKGATRDVGAILAEPFIDPRGGGAAVEWANGVADALRAFERQLRPAVQFLSQQAGPAFQATTRFLQQLADAIGSTDITSFLREIAAGGPVLVGFAGAALAAGSASVLGAIGMGSLAAAISPLAAGLIALAVASPEAREAILGVGQAAAPLLPVLTDLIIQVSGLASTVLGTAAGLAGSLVPALSAVVTIIEPVVAVAALLVDGIASLPEPARNAAVALLLLSLAARRAFLMVAGFGWLSITASLVGLADAASKARFALAGLAIAFAVWAAEKVASIWDDTAAGMERIQAVDVSGLVTDLQTLMRTGNATGGLKTFFGEGAESAADFADKLDIATASWGSWSNFWDRTGNEREGAKEAFRTLDAAMSDLVSSGEDAQEVLDAVAKAYSLNKSEVDQLLEVLPQYNTQAQRQADQAELGADAANEFAAAQDGLAESTDRARLSLAELADEIRAQTDPVFAAIKATQEFEKAQVDYQEAVSKHGETSSEATEALWELLDAELDVLSATSELKDQTSVLPAELIAMAEAAGVGAGGIEALRESFGDMMDAGEDVRSTITDMNADITTSTGQMAVVNALVWAGIGDKQAETIVRMKARVDELIAAGWSYEDAIEQVSRESNTHTAVIESGFKDARKAGLEFSDDYPASVTLSGVGGVMSALDRLNQRINSMNKTVTISFQHRNFASIDGVLIPGMSEGGRVAGPRGAGDVVPRMLQPDEHVWTVREVEGAGGHAGVEALRAAALANHTRFAQSSPAPSWSTMSAPRGGAGMHVDTLKIETVTGAYDHRQVMTALAYEGVS